MVLPRIGICLTMKNPHPPIQFTFIFLVEEHFVVATAGPWFLAVNSGVVCISDFLEDTVDYPKSVDG